MIICASRRTDIPAFHADWMMNRMREGEVYVRNPVARNVIYRVDLSRRNVDCIVFITKDPRPMLPYLKEIGSMGHMYTFQVTITPYGKDIEPGVPFKADVADAFKEISDMIGCDRVLWRYDPIIVNDRMGLDYHRRKFELLCKELEGYTERCTFSFIDMYGKLGRYSDSGVLRGVSRSEKMGIAGMMASVASKYGIGLSSCCSNDFTTMGIESRGCIDGGMMRSLNVPFEDMSVPLRKGCRCIRNIDIGAYDTCNHNCIYCYANRVGSDSRSDMIYDPNSKMLEGEVREDDVIIDLTSRDVSRIDDF